MDLQVWRALLCGVQKVWIWCFFVVRARKDVERPGYGDKEHHVIVGTDSDLPLGFGSLRFQAFLVSGLRELAGSACISRGIGRVQLLP